MYEDNKTIGKNSDIFLFCLTAIGESSFSERKKLVNILIEFEKNFNYLPNSLLSYGVDEEKNLMLKLKDGSKDVLYFYIKGGKKFIIDIEEKYVELLLLHSMFYIYGDNSVVDVISERKELKNIDFDIKRIVPFMELISGICEIKNKATPDKINHRYNLILNNIDKLENKDFYFSNNNKGHIENEKDSSISINNIHTI